MNIPDSLPLNNKGKGVALITMPFANIHCPSLSIGLLKSIAELYCIECDDFYFNLEFARYIGIENYLSILEFDSFCAGDFVFSGFLCKHNETIYENYIRKARKASAYCENLELIRNLRANFVQPFLEKIVEEVDWETYEIIGLTSTFQQHAATLALAKLIKLKYPFIPIICGGANFHGIMGIEWLKFAHYIDYICNGEGDSAFPELIQSLRLNQEPEKISNICYRKNGNIISYEDNIKKVNIESLPFPNFDTYYQSVKKLEITKEPIWSKHALLIETSRGCWWGQKRHCVFCGLNNENILFRSKSPERVFNEISYLSKRYTEIKFQVVDNIINPKFKESLFKKFSDERYDLEFFLEIKANQKRTDIRKFRKGGVIQVQPGIESLNSHLLKIMNKGVTGIQNVYLLKWARYYRMVVNWNLLCGFFGEKKFTMNNS